MYAFIATALIAAVLAGAGAWRVQNWRFAAIEKDRIEAQAEKERNDRKAIDVAAEGHETFKAASQARERIVKQEVDRVVEKLVYRNVCLDDDGLSILAADIAARNIAGQPPGPMPAASSPDGKGRSVRPAVGP